MKKNTICVTVIILFLLIVTAFVYPEIKEIKNPDKPLKGEWPFALKQVWEIANAGDDLIGAIRQLVIAKDGRIYASDVRTQKFYILDKDGKLIKAFGSKGEGPDEIKRIGTSRMYLVNDKLLILDSGRVHYFTLEGKYIQSVVNPWLPHFFIDEDTFITAPLFAREVKDGIAHISLYNLKTKQQTQIYEYPFYDKSSTLVNGHPSTFIRTGVTPMMVIGCVPGGNTLYFGVNDSYKIHIANLKGEISGIFYVDREPTEITKEMKQIDLDAARKLMPPSEYEKLLTMKGPKYTTFFGNIETHNGLIYVFPDEPYKPQEQSHRMLVDIFSPEGKYLYRGDISLKPGQVIGSSAAIYGNHLYTGLMNEDDDIVIAKYEINLPTE